MNGFKALIIALTSILLLAGGVYAMGSKKGATAAEAGSAKTVAINVKEAMKPRTLGNPDAKVKIEEFASLTCSHCAHFSKDNFPRLREAYIDTGKAHFVFHDFPLNAPALQASMVARCLPEAQYFQFISFLFETQDNWAFGKDFSNNLRQGAKLAGMDDVTFDSCINNEDLKKAIVDRMQDYSQKYKIESTPSFVINESQTLKGALALESFASVIDPLLAKSE